MYKLIGGDGKEYGPVSAEQLRQWVAEGRVNVDTKVCAEGTAEWKPLSAFPEFAAQAGIAAPPSVAPPSASARAPIAQGQVPSYLVQSILCTILCCLPLGVVAIIYAAQVGSKLSAGDFQGAVDSSNKAKMWCWISFGCGILCCIVGGLLGFIGGIMENRY